LSFESAAAAATLIKKIQLGIYPTKSVFMFVGPGEWIILFAFCFFKKRKKRNVFEFYLDGLSGFQIFIRLIVRQHFQQQLLFEFD
jgi:hypothetical protein